MVRLLMCLGLGLTCVPVALVATAHAQAPSFDSIFNGLSDKPFASGHRGIRPAAPVAQNGGASSSAAYQALPATAPVAAPTHAAQPSRVAAAAPTARPVVATAPAAAAPTTSESATPANPEPRSINLTIEFISGSDQLTPAATSTLDLLGSVLADSRMQGNRFRLEGHTDTAGNPETNRVLSERRARTVETYLVAKFHIDPARLEALGRGQEDLLVPTPPQTPEPRNRRVRVINLGA